MDNWGLTSFTIEKTVDEKKLDETSVVNYGGELAASFSDYGFVDYAQSSAYFSAPEEFLRNQVSARIYLSFTVL
jgi:hypothetical protein